jgi:plastocyanin
MQSIFRRRSRSNAARGARVRALHACVAVIALVLLTSCAGPGAKAATGKTYAVSMDGTAFVAPDITVDVGDTIVWKNEDPFPHTATSQSAGFDSKKIREGQSWSYTTTKKGDFHYVCTLHENMTGVIHVR